MRDLTLSVIMPALNEEANIKNAIESTLRGFKKYGISGEVIVVNDGSSDGTKRVVETIILNTSRVKIVNHKKSMGVGFSFFDGVKHSSKDIVVMFPGDNENDPDDALSFLSLMRDVDIIIPFIHNFEVRDKTRRIISSLYRFIINMSFGISLNYTNGTVFYRRCILEKLGLQSSGFFYQAELLIKLIRKGYLYAEVPNFLSVRGGGQSKATTLRSLLAVMRDYLKLVVQIHVKALEDTRDYKKLNPQSVSYQKIHNLISANT